jgi:TolB protein
VSLRLIVLCTLLYSVAACSERPTTNGERDDDARDEPASEWIVFSSARSGNGDVYAVYPPTGEVVRVFGSDAPEGGPRYDAARDRIVVQRFAGESDGPMLVADGVDLFEDPSGDNPPAWSPTGAWIAYAARRDGREDVFIASPDGSGERRLTDDDEIDRYPAWSPDGETIVFARRLESGWDLHTIDVSSDDPAPVRLTHDGDYVGHPSWSPDGRFIAFDTMVRGQSEIAMVEIASGTVTCLTDRPGNDLVPTWSSDARSIAFGGVTESTSNWDVWLVDVGSSQLTRLTTDPGFDGAPVFVPASTIGR